MMNKNEMELFELLSEKANLEEVLKNEIEVFETYELIEKQNKALKDVANEKVEIEIDDDYTKEEVIEKIKDKEYDLEIIDWIDFDVTGTGESWDYNNNGDVSRFTNTALMTLTTDEEKIRFHASFIFDFTTKENV